jgi:hypothetical protein
METPSSRYGRVLKTHPNEKPSVIRKIEKVIKEQQSHKGGGSRNGSSQQLNHAKKK